MIDLPAWTTAFASLANPVYALNTTLLAVEAVKAIDTAVDAPFVLSGVLISLIVIYLAAKLGGELCIRVNLPPVLGELTAGVIVGISALNLLIFPDGQGFHSPILDLLQTTAGLESQSVQNVAGSIHEVISVLSELGVIILLFEIGLESDLKELIRVGPQAAAVAVVGVAVPFALGTAGLITIFDVAIVPAIFAGAALTATSIGITAKVLAEIGQLSSKEGQIIIGAAVLDDILGIIILAVVASLAKTGEIRVTNIIYLIVSASVFLIGAILLGRLLSPYFVALVEGMQTRGQLLLASLIFAFTLAYIGAAIHLEAILGAFAAGLVLAETEKRKDLEEQIAPIADMLVPIFFVVVGAKTDVSVLNPINPANREGLIIALFLVIVAVLGKLVTGATVSRQAGVNRWAIGIGMIPRGEVGLVFAGVGSATGILSNSLNAAIIIMVILTTFLAPPLLRIAFQSDLDLKKLESLQKSE